MPASSFLSVLEALLRHGVPRERASKRAMNELRGFEPQEIEAIFRKVDRPNSEYCPMASLDAAGKEAADRVERTAVDQSPNQGSCDEVEWISPSYELMRKAATDRKALCVNEDGQLEVLASDYVALSHVWAEGLQRDRENDGIQLSKIRKVFETLKQAKIDAKWVWTDTLAIPVTDGDKTCIENEMLKTDLINLMPDIYRNAKAVAIFDALVLQLRSEHWLDAAVLVLCGRWITRVWTFQEIILASTAWLVTAQGYHLWKDIVDRLQDLREKDEYLYKSFHITAAILGWGPNRPLPLRDIVFACSERQAGVDVDHARAFFPILGLEWKPGWTREQGMEAIYKSRWRDATQIATFFGSPCLSTSPSWLPSYLTGLEGIVTPSMDTGDVGARAEWYVLKLGSLQHEIVHRNRIALNFSIDDQLDDKLQLQIIRKVHIMESTNITNAIDENRLYILSSIEFSRASTEMAHCVLLATGIQRKDSEELVAVVLCTALLSTRVRCISQRRSIFIVHQRPSRSEDPEQDVAALENEQSDRNERGAVEHESAPGLREAICNRDFTALTRLLLSGLPSDTLDDNGFTALHTAAVRGENGILGTLLSYCSMVDIRSQSLPKVTPLFMAAITGHTETVRFLVQRGADINAKHDWYDDSEEKNSAEIVPIMVAAREDHAETVRVLIEMGADPNCRSISRQSSTSLCMALSKNCSLETVKVLVKGGADVNSPQLPQKWSPLYVAAKKGSKEAVRYLLTNGAALDAGDINLLTPLCSAVLQGHADCVRLLLDAGAKTDVVGANGWTVVHRAVAAKKQRFEILTMLLERPVNLDIPELSHGWAPLHLAILRRIETICIRKLLASGANVLVFTTDLVTPLEYALMNKSYAAEQRAEIVNLLCVACNIALQTNHTSIEPILADIRKRKKTLEGNKEGADEEVYEDAVEHVVS